MEKKDVRSFQEPEVVEVFPQKDCYMRKNIIEHEDEENGKYFSYDEVFFISDATKEEILADFDTFYEAGKEYNPTPADEPTWQDRIEAQVTLTALATGTLIGG